MGVVRQLIQVAVTEALKGRTIAGQAVHDSLIKALPQIMKGEVHPVVAVSIEDCTSQDGDGLFRTDASMTLMLQLAIAKSVTVPVIEGEDALEIGDTDAALEASLNLLDRQWRIALSDPLNAWAELFRQLVPHVGKVSDIRLTDPETGRKHAARIVEITIAPIAEPYPGQADTDVVRAGLAQMAAIADYADLAAILTASLDAGATLFDWQIVQGRLLSLAAMPALIGVGTPDDGEEVLLTETTLDIAGEIEVSE
ncbi:MAG: hypothetical protein H5U11_04335 [Rhizobium sp.]|nr:hypothetical protein [Rhizobium sp.]